MDILKVVTNIEVSLSHDEINALALLINNTSASVKRASGLTESNIDQVNAIYRELESVKDIN